MVAALEKGPFPEGAVSEADWGSPLHGKTLSRIETSAGAKNNFKKVLTSPPNACNIMQVGGRQREHSTADSDETNEAKLLHRERKLFASGKWLNHL